MKKLGPVSCVGFITAGILSLLLSHAQCRHFETADTIVIEALKLKDNSGDGLPIIQGQKKFPHLASIMRDGNIICAGAIIDNIHVLSSAYCLPNITSEELPRYQIGIGYQKFADDTPPELKEKEGPYYLRRILKVIMDRTYYYQSMMIVKNSLVILKLDAPITSNDYVQPSYLSFNSTTRLTPKSRNGPLKSAKLCGWRKSKEATGKEVAFLRGVNLRIHTYEECQKEFLNSKKMDDIICASNASENPCYFELGSPLTVRRHGKNILIGVRERDCHFPNIFTRVDYFLPWLAKNLVY